MPLLAGRTTLDLDRRASGPVPLGLVYIDPDGNRWRWSDIGADVFASNVAGLGSPPVAFTSVALPSGGALGQDYRGTARSIIVSLAVENPDQDKFLEVLDRLTLALWTERAGEPAPGTLIVQRPGGTARQIRVIQTGGPDQPDDDRDKSGLTWASFPVTFRAVDPFWQDADPTELEFRGPTAGAGVPPMPPVVLSSSAVLGEVQVTNSGQADAYLLWTLTGPGAPVLGNSTTGRAWTFEALGAGEVVTVNTGPSGEAYAIDATGADRWGGLVKSSPRDLWALVRGRNDLNLAMTGAAAGSKIGLSYTRRWLRA